MARNDVWIAAPPEAVWAVLADPGAYADWVVGVQRVSAADPSWPAPGSRLHHRSGLPPLMVRDRTCVERSEPGRRLELDAAARPFGRARVEIVLTAEAGGTRLRLFEEPSGIAAPLRFNPMVQLVLKVRNAEALRRLAELAERRHRGAERARRRATARGVAAAGQRG